MSDTALPLASTPPLSQPMRVIDTFVAPLKTFADILRSANCWLPLVLMLLMTIAWSVTVDKKVGFAAVSDVQMQKNPERAAQMQNLPAEQRATQMELVVKMTRGFTYGSVVFVLIFMLVEALVLWAIFNLALGATTQFPQVFAVVAFAGLPRMLMLVISMVLLLAGVGVENFDIQNPVGTNLGYFLTESPKWLQAGGRFFDVLGLWSLFLLVLGMAIIAKKKMSVSALIIVGLWAVGLVLTVGFTAAFS